MLVIKNRRLRTALHILIPFFAVPAAALLGILVFDEKKHLFVSLFVAVMTLLLFISGFEKQQIGARQLVLVSVMNALSVAGRFIPFFKPVTALTIITAMYLGGEAGFMVGAFSAFLSNFYFGQGPWTPFQMLAWGLIGLLAGALGAPLRRNRWLLAAYGVASGVAFSAIMDVFTVLWYHNGWDSALYLAALGTALPYTVLYALSNFLFLLAFARPFGEKLSRIKIKYGV